MSLLERVEHRVERRIKLHGEYKGKTSAREAIDEMSPSELLKEISNALEADDEGEG